MRILMKEKNILKSILTHLFRNLLSKILLEELLDLGFHNLKKGQKLELYIHVYNAKTSQILHLFYQD
jgi:hypothetical protein